jgi:hypothetical protein
VRDTFRSLLICLAFASASSSANAPLPLPSKLTVCSPDRAFCAVASPTSPSLAVFPACASSPLWSLPTWHRYFFLANGGDHLVLGPEGLNLLALNVRPTDSLLVFTRRGAIVRIVRVGDLFPNLRGLQRTVSHFAWGSIVGINARNQLIVELVTGRRLAFGVSSGLIEEEK